MNTISTALAVSGAGALTGAAAGLGLPARIRSWIAGALTAVVGAAGLAAGASALTGRTWSASFPSLLPLAGVRLRVDALSGLFMAVAGAVVVAVAVYGIGYARGGHGPVASRPAQAVLPLFAATLVLVPAASSVSTFLLLWELMALTSLLLVLVEHAERSTVRSAGIWYAVMTHLGLVLLLTGLALFAAKAGGESFDALRAGAHLLSPTVRGLVFVLCFAAFASKAGAVPLHAWLPRAHPEAPSQVSALMSAAMVNLGVYGTVRVGFDLLGAGSRWWWLTVLVTGAASAVYGILQATLATDLKRLLAYSTCENLGLVFVGVGAAGLFHAGGDPALAGLALAAALLHVVNHAGFKALGFTAAGSVLRATGERNLDRLGGLRAKMPATASLFALAALGAVALPPGNGFVSEWLLLQSLIHGLAVPGLTTAIVLPLAVAAIALSAGLAAAAFVKALGVGFFARPRSPQATGATESPALMLTGMGLLAAACAALALVPGVLADPLARAVAASRLTGIPPLTGGELRLRLTDTSAAYAPLWLAAALVVSLVLAGAGQRAWRRRSRRRAAKLWDCGGGQPTPRMAYTATSFAEPLQRVFDDVLAPEQDVNVTHVRESIYLVERVRYTNRVPDRIEHRLYTPLLALFAEVGSRARRLAAGSVHVYLGYGFVGVVALLGVLTVLK
ncbi:proton-conducting transporter membrane subunit [Streptacidiphilus sp. MAP5-52]|uniref:proton-conducting transporter transmembrane domain-containing protein n=1 Tax=Streptacidiphilus sp. MAP5-52 TaxID=3156267 RepID=UPI0035127475